MSRIVSWRTDNHHQAPLKKAGRLEAYLAIETTSIFDRKGSAGKNFPLRPGIQTALVQGPCTLVRIADNLFQL